MTKSLTTFNEFSNSRVDNNRWQLYFLLGIVANAAIWGSAAFILKVQRPIYTSTLNTTLPGSGSAAHVSLPNIGQASYETSSPYGNSSTQDPRETYKAIATSEPVIKAAAKKLNMSLYSFGMPRLKIL